MSLVVTQFDRESTAQLLTALRLLEGRLLPSGQRLCPGLLELRDALSRPTTARTGQQPPGPVAGREDGDVTPLLDAAEVRWRLNVSERTVRRLVADGDLSALRIGTRVRFDPVEVAAFLTRARTDTTETA